MILRTISRRWTAVLAFSLMTAALARAVAQEEAERMSIPPRPGLTCTTLKCAPGHVCVHSAMICAPGVKCPPDRPARCVPLPRGRRCATMKCAPDYVCVEKGPSIGCVPSPKTEGELKVGDLNLFACVNGLMRAMAVPIEDVTGTKAQENSFPRLQATPMPVGGAVPKPQPVVGMTKQEAQAIGCLKRFGYFEKQQPPNDPGEGKVCDPAPDQAKPACYPVRWDREKCRYICGGAIR